MIGRLTWHQQVLCLLLLFLYACFQVDCIISELDPGPPLNSSSSNSTVLCHPKQSFALLQFKSTTSTSFHPKPQPEASSVYPYFIPIVPNDDCYPKTDSWMEGRDCCSWDGVTCDEATGNVIGVHLGYSCLAGTINQNSSLFQILSHLQWLILSVNGLKGSIPESLSTLEQLTYIDLSHNQLSGQIPDTFSSLHLTFIDLSHNQLSGDQILDTFGNFSDLNILNLSNNNFTGPISRDLCELLNLTALDLSYNFFNERVPSCLFTVPSLVSLILSNNQLTGSIGQFELRSSELDEVYLDNNNINGSIPGSIFELVNLHFLDLSSNNLSGTIKFDMLSNLRLLMNLDLSGNTLLSFTSDNNVNNTSTIDLNYLKFSSCNISEFPSFLSTLGKLTWLDLSNNRINGHISKNGSGEWKSLTILNLANNFLTHIEHYPWKNIQSLDLRNNMLQGSLLVPPSTSRIFLASDNKFTGKIPAAICNLSSLIGLDLSNNSLSWEIPTCLGNSSIMLSMLHLQKNNLRGRIPGLFAKGSRLTSLDLGDNKLDGTLPRSLANCSRLEVINVGHNMISDTFPYWLGTLPNLTVLVLRANRFHGQISDYKTISSFSKLRIIDLSHNEFTGFLPKTLFENLEAMMNVSMTENESRYMGRDFYQDSVNVTMKGRDIEINRIINIFTAIDLSSNNFQGGIPEEFANLKSLIVLNLACNSLTGNIPKWLGNLTALESLDLSANKLDGRIPVQLESLTFLQALNLSHNKLSGPIPPGGQLTTFENDSFIGNIWLCGKPLSVKCGNAEAPQLPPVVFHDEDDTENRFDWKITMMGYGCGLVIGLSMGYIVFSIEKPWWFIRMIEGNRKIWLKVTVKDVGGRRKK